MKSSTLSVKFKRFLGNKRLVGLVVVLVVGAVGAYALVGSRAATPFITAEAESGTVSSPASTVSDATASGSGAVKFAAASSGSTLMGWQLTTTNVGLAPHGLSCDTLPVYTGASKPAAGARITGVRINSNLDLVNGDIIIEQSCIRPTSGDNRALISNDVCGADECVVPAGSKMVTIRDSEIDASLAPAQQIAGSCAFRGVGTLQRNYIHGMGSGICFFGTGFELDAVADQNYVTGMRSFGDSHNESATIRDFRRNTTNTRLATFLNNRLDADSGNVTAGIYISTTWVDIYNVVVQGNYIEGGGYNLYIGKGLGNYDNIKAINNRMRPTGWGPAVVDGGGPGFIQWTDNYRYDATKPDGKGAVVPEP